MASVYLARELALDRFVAIKVLRPDLALAENHRERFRREARIAANLSHPGILALHSFGEIDNLWYFVMTYVRGETLAEKIKREGVIHWIDAHRIVSEITDALACAHRGGVVHRDIKPANILIESETGRAMLADFGISKITGGGDSLTSTGAVVGTPDYMSPEQVTAGAEVDERSDIYSLGTVAYVMLTGREPFHSDNTMRTLYRRLLEDPVPVSTLVPSVPPDLSTLVQKCMARERNDRWTDARALRQALDNIVAVDHLPDAVRDLPSFGAYALLWLAGWIAFAFSSDRSDSERALLLLVSLLAPAGLMLHMRNGAARGMRFAELTRIAFWPPEWWSVWWPSSLRRPTDIWNRLPWVARATRMVITIGTAVLLVLIFLSEQILGSAADRYSSWLTTAEWAIAILVAVSVGVAFLWARQRGVGLEHSPTLLLGPTLASSSWRDHQMTRILAPDAGGVRTPNQDIPADYLRAIHELIPRLGSTGKEIGPRVIAAAECLLSAIGQSDKELESIARDAGPTEANRLSAQLAVLGSEEDGDTGERRELRELVRHQLQLVHKMQSRREVILSERSHCVDMLRTLWTLLAAAGEAEVVDRSGLGRIEVLCAEVQRSTESESRIPSRES